MAVPTRIALPGRIGCFPGRPLKPATIGFVMLHVYSFPPIASVSARVLILGTMPGQVSLRERQYYAHPQNAFWRIVGGILGFDPALPYEARVAAVQAARIAVWDVLKSCIRPSSMDSAIDTASAVPNDFATFLADHPQIRRICFNGATAEALFTKHVRPRVAPDEHVQYVRLPSTSPANASVPLPAKIRAWQAILP
jgi:hypoxanthine-DNA glycosylase